MEGRTAFKIDLPDIYQQGIDIEMVELHVKVLYDLYGAHKRKGLVAEYTILPHCLPNRKIDLFLILVIKQPDAIRMIAWQYRKNKIFFAILVYDPELEGIRGRNTIVFIAGVTSRYQEGQAYGY